MSRTDEHIEAGAGAAGDFRTDATDTGGARDADGDTDLDDMLQELRILLNGVQVLTAFLILLPFNQRFHHVPASGKWVYVATFLLSISCIVFFSAPAAQHRLERPLRDRREFKHFATRMIVMGMVPFSLTLVLASYLVVTEAVGASAGAVVAALIALLIGLNWWLIPLIRKRGTGERDTGERGNGGRGAE